MKLQEQREQQQKKKTALKGVGMVPRRRFSEARIERGGDGDYAESELTGKIIGCAIAVHRALGPGFLEAIYEKSLALELVKQGLRVERQRIVRILYDGVEVGEHRIDLLVEGKVVLELKCVDTIIDRHLAQVISTLKAIGLQIGLLINFDEARLIDGVRRVILTSQNQLPDPT